MPPFLDPAVITTMQRYVRPASQPDHYIGPQQIGQKRRDSVVYSQQMPYADPPRNSIDADSPAANSQISGLSRDTIFSIHSSVHAGQPDAPRKQSSFRFVVTTNPNQPENRVEKRENRAHVMHDYLDKERRKTPSARDIRAGGSRQSEARRRLTSCSKRLKKPRQLPQPRSNFEQSMPTPQSLYSSSLVFGSEHEGTVSSNSASQTTRDTESSVVMIPPSSYVGEECWEGDETPASACPSPGSGFVHFPGSCNCPWPEQDLVNGCGVLDLPSFVRFRVAPDRTWLQSTKTTVNLEKLKYTCGLRLRSCAMADTWLPNLIRERHSFLSTICISAAHDEAMQRTVFGSASLRGPKKDVVYERLAVKTEVIAMINKCLRDEKQQTSDATIIAVLNILNSEMIGCDPEALRYHQQGLNRMVVLRGGLDELGVLGHLARTLTITMLLNAALQEEVADNIYLRYAEMRAAPPQDGMVFPESPICCGRQCSTVTNVLGRKSSTLALLKLLRKMTCVYQAHDEPDNIALRYYHGEIMRFESDAGGEQPMRMVRVHEAIRLTARLYADALVDSVQFSEMASRPVSSQNATAGRMHERKPARYVEIVRHLKHTDLDRVWGGLSGILFWIVLVAGAASKKAQPTHNGEARDPVSDKEQEEARQWLAAVAVRCSIILGFEHGRAVLGSLKNILDVQDRLGRRLQSQWQVMIGPKRENMPQNGFSDFARDFLAEDQ